MAVAMKISGFAELAVETVQISSRIEGGLVALHLPDHFTEAIHDRMLGIHGVAAVLLEQALVA